MDEEDTLVRSENTVRRHKTDKTQMARRLLKRASEKKRAHRSKFVRYKWFSTFLKMMTAVMSAVSMTAIVMAYADVVKPVLIVSLTASSIALLISSATSVLDLDGKWHNHQTSALQYSDLVRDIGARLLRDDLESNDLDEVLKEINCRLGLIEDNAPPITLSRSESILA